MAKAENMLSTRCSGKGVYKNSPFQPFRFTDLAPELRNMVYEFATFEHFQPNEENSDLTTTWNGKVLPGISHSAKALDQVSRIIRAECLSVYFADSTFELDYFNQPRGLEEIGTWVTTWGTLAIPRMRSICVIFPFTPRIGNSKKIFICAKGPGPLVSFEVANNWDPENKPDLNKLVTTILQPNGSTKLTTESLELLLAAMQLLHCAWQAMIYPPRKTWEDLLKKLTSKAGQEEVIADGKLSTR